MRLKQMSLVGFKSFAERTCIDLRNRLTAIVGPNGCGKSNIVDAFRWVLGEQSVKSLRGSSMSDVVFNGTDSRPAAGFAEVTLHLEAPELAPKMEGERQLVIKRKLFRDGTSEYYLNGKPSRLKDIKHLLADTGIGATYYSVITQQNIDTILQMDAVKRRELLEEAAGVRGYRMQRDTAASELERARNSLANITAQIAELEAQKRKLEGQAAKARRYAKLTERMKNLRRALFELRKKKIEQELAIVTPQLDEARTTLCKLRTDYEAISAEFQERQHRLRKLEQRSVEVEKEKERLSQEIKECELSIVTARTEISACVRDIEHLKNRVEFEQGRKEEFLQKLKTKEEELNALKESCRLAQEELTRLRAKSDELRKIVQGLEQAKGEILRRQESLLEDEVRSKNESADAVRQLERLEKERNRLLSERGELEKSMKENGEKVNELYAKLKSVEQKLSSLFPEGTTLKMQIGSLDRRIKHIKKRFEALCAEETHLKVEQDALEHLLSERADIKTINAVVNSLIRDGYKVFKLVDFVECDINSKNAKSLSLLLSPIERTLVVETEEAVRAFLNKKAELGKLHIKFVVLNRLPQELPPIPDGITVKPEAESCVRYLCAGAKFGEDPLSQKETFCFNDEGVIVRGATIEVSGGELSLLEIKQRVQEIENRKDFLARRKHQLEERLNSLEQSPNDKNSSLENVQNRISLMRKECDIIASEKEWLEREKSDIERRFSLLDSEFEFCNHEEKRLKEILVESEKTLNEVTTGQERLRSERANLEQKLTQIRNELFKLQSEESETGVKAARIEEQVIAREKEIEDLNNVLVEASAQMKKSSITLEERINKQKQLENQISEAEKRRESALTRISAIMKEKQEIGNALASLRSDDEQTEKRRKELYKSLEEQTKVEQSFALKQTSLMEQNQALMRQALEIGIDVSQSMQIDPAALEIEGELTEEMLKSEIESCEHKITGLGSINQTAGEELEGMLGKLTFFKAQETDLNKAIKSLVDTITELDGFCKERLEKVFQEVKHHFGEMFRRLFNGGNAELSLTSENILEAGLEVMARPPGKKNSTIAQLSGGERAMCAIALLFSIYKTRPSPVCILDEIDAPLDDMNVASFLSLLREFSQTTQFLVITHSKQTIAGLDDAVGVTMPTPGISDIVSVSIAEAAELAAQSA